jgi:hypothetical protein
MRTTVQYRSPAGHDDDARENGNIGRNVGLWQLHVGMSGVRPDEGFPGQGREKPSRYQPHGFAFLIFINLPD